MLSAVRPVGLQPVPVRVVRHVAPEVAPIVRHIVTGPLARCDPVRLTLEHRQMLDLVDTRVDDLDRGAARPDDGDPFAGEVERRVPLRGVNTDAREGVPACQLGPARAVEVAGRGDHDAGIADVTVAVAVHRVDLPLIAILVPPQGLDLGAEPGVLAQTVLVGQRHQIVLILRTLRVVARPFRVHLARQRVVRRRGVHADPGIDGGQPRTAHVVVAVEDLELHAGVCRGKRGDDAGEPRTDDGDVHGLRDRHRTRKGRLREPKSTLLEQ